MDDLIFSGAGSGCAGDDEDAECKAVYDPLSGRCKYIFFESPVSNNVPSFSFDKIGIRLL